MIRKIYLTILLIISCVSLLIIGNQIVIYQFKASSDKLLLEYNELYTLQDFKVSLLEIPDQLPDIELISEKQHFQDSLIYHLETKKNNCEIYVSGTHLNEHWDELQEYYNEIINPLSLTPDIIDLKSIKAPVVSMKGFLDKMILETSHEINETEEKNKTIQKHGSLTLLVIGLLFIGLISWSSFSTTRSITRPVRKFLNTFKKLVAGEKNARVNITSKDEFGLMGKEFNFLFDKLDETTVTLKYVRNILDNIFGALFVTDEEGHITFCNKVASKLLGYKEEEMLGKQISILFNRGFENFDSKKSTLNISTKELLIEEIKNANEMYTGRGEIIPVMMSCTESSSDKENRLIVVAHDITEKIELEKKYRRIKKENLVAINEAQEIERTRIAADLHDGLGQKLSAISYVIEQITNDTRPPSKLGKLQKIVDDAIHETRTISHSLMPGILMDFGLIPALNDLIDSYKGSSNMDLEFNHYDFHNRIDPKLEKVLYRICQEALNNILKHSEAQNATFQLFNSDEFITLTIEDDGKGFEQDKILPDQNGIGLISIRERVYSYDGTFSINSSINMGTELIIEIPYNN